MSGVETSKVDEVAIGNFCEELTRKVKITSAQLLALFTTSVEIVPAPGADEALELVSMLVHKPAGTAYAGIAAGEDLAVKYTGSAGAQVNTDLETTGFLDQVTAQTRLTRPIVTEFTPVVAAPLHLHLLTDNITTGTSDLYLIIRYRKWKRVTDNPAA